jgi:predicted DNA-binding transcriptional regulator YafY
MQDSRLFKMIYYLLDVKQTTAAELADKFEVSIRTVYRDIDKISQAGIPVYANQGRNGGIYIYEDFVLDKRMLSQREKDEIVFGLQSLTATMNPDLDVILHKLGAIFQTQQWIRVDFSRWGNDTVKENEIFYLLKQAILEKHYISFIYYAVNGVKERRKIEPLQLLYKDKAWYVYGFCLLRQRERFFRVSRMLDMVLHDETFTRIMNTVSFDAWDPKPLIDVELQFPSNVGYRLYDVLDPQVIHEIDIGYVVKMKIPKDDWITTFILSFGDQVTIISPTSLKEKMHMKYLQAIQKLERKEENEC